ncbi:MAG: D-aminoacylase [bacterium]|nr:D-aminoacylase [bacterium]MXZ31321.1 D-aminoacylase [Acidimicrobiia bacterium]MYB24572.1 D-aminoacylase [Acidimicrobiia bacterium]MYE67095.1 D-aminoacylase [Acidimicrobiia bacterium]MYJ14809.1 D-aminoacylase [Acidimicrobiia bacterium]
MHDLVLAGGHLVDGTGGAPFRADVAVSEGRIAALGRAGAARRVIDVSGHLVAPGFVDMHSHSDLALLADPAAAAKVMQGVTGEVVGQDGLAYAPLDDVTLATVRTQTAGWVGDPPGLDYGWRSVADYLGRLEASPPSLNVAFLVPHGNLRMMTVGTEDRPATALELEQMRALVRQGMAEGALGLSTGLTYTPAMYAGADELVALCAEIVAGGGYFSPHTRSYGRGVMEAYDEMIDVCRRSGAPLHLTHCQVSFPGNEGRAGELVDRLAAIDPRTLEISADSYCYVPGSTYMAAFLPNWAWTEGPEGVLAHLADPAAAERIRVELEEVGTDGFHGALMDWSAIEISSVGSEAGRRWIGRRVAEIAAELAVSPWEAVRRLMLDERLNVNILTHVGHEDNVRAIMQLPFHMGGSDGIMTGTRPHPRAWGTFARYLAHYARDEGLFGWPEIVRKLSALPNLRLRQFDRGLLRPGYWADIVVFDPDGVRDTATFENPRRHPEGMPWVLVNGELVKDDDAHTGARPGRVLRSQLRAAA